MYALVKFQLDMQISLALQSSNNKKIILYSKHWENELQALTNTDITYEWNVTQSCNLHHRVHHKQGHLLLYIFLVSSSFTMHRDETCEDCVRSFQHDINKQP